MADREQLTFPILIHSYICWPEREQVEMLKQSSYILRNILEFFVYT